MHLLLGTATRVTPRCSPLGRLNVQNEEIDEMIKEAPGPINFTVFLTMFGEKLKGKGAREELGGAGGHPVPPGEATHLLRPPSPSQAGPVRGSLEASDGSC